MGKSRRRSLAENVARMGEKAECREDLGGKIIRNETTRETKT
jgi:hypothetical protein